VQSSLSGNGIRAALEQGDILEKYNGRALRSAVAHGHLEAARALLDAGARTDTRLDVEPSGMVPGTLSKDRLGGATLLHLCASAPHLDRMAALLLQQGADASACTSGTQNMPLHLASTFGCADVARALLAGGAPSNVRNAKGYAPLHLAVSHKHAACAVALLQGSTDVNFKTASGNTALHIVCETTFSKPFDRALATLLLQYGANPELRNNDNHTPLECVTWLGPHRAAFQQLVAQQAAAVVAARVSVSQAEAAKAKAKADAAKATSAEVAKANKRKAESDIMDSRLQAERAKAAASNFLAPAGGNGADAATGPRKGIAALGKAVADRAAELAEKQREQQEELDAVQAVNELLAAEACAATAAAYSGAAGAAGSGAAGAAAAVEDEAPSCAICLNEMTKGVAFITNSCGHAFHVDCQASAVAAGLHSCSLCRAPLTLTVFGAQPAARGRC
jgi:ankyrin repeat protein